jgi:hypothetical protein
MAWLPALTAVTPRERLGRQVEHDGERAAWLEAPAVLEQLELEQHVGTVAERLARGVRPPPPRRGAEHVLAEPLARGSDLLERWDV